jgi:hypothetical protein
MTRAHCRTLNRSHFSTRQQQEVRLYESDQKIMITSAVLTNSRQQSPCSWQPPLAPLPRQGDHAQTHRHQVRNDNFNIILPALLRYLVFGRRRFKSPPEHRIFLLRIFVIVISLSKQMSSRALNFITAASFHIASNSLSSYRSPPYSLIYWWRLSSSCYSRVILYPMLTC